MLHQAFRIIQDPQQEALRLRVLCAGESPRQHPRAQLLMHQFAMVAMDRPAGGNKVSEAAHAGEVEDWPGGRLGRFFDEKFPLGLIRMQDDDCCAQDGDATDGSVSTFVLKPVLVLGDACWRQIEDIADDGETLGSRWQGKAKRRYRTTARV